MRRVCAALALALVAGSLSGQVAWGKRPPTTAGPPGRFSQAMAGDSARGEIVMFGGALAAGTGNDTWIWRGSWAQRFTAHVPPPRRAAAAVFQSVRGKTVMFGGYDPSSNVLNDTWEWDGTDWTLRTPLHAPRAMAEQRLAYDPGQQRAVLYGGYDVSPIGEVWEWDGSDWYNRTPATGPTPRIAPALCFDAGRRICLMFGGFDTGGYRGDTWTWDGRKWTQLFPPDSPPPRLGASMVYDPARDRVVLFGGETIGATVGDTWEWDGTTWILRSLGPWPGQRSAHAMALDHATGRVVMFGGNYGANPPLDDTWEYFNLTPASFDPLGPGCAGTAGTPVLAPLGNARPWIGETFELDLRPLPPSVLAAPFILLGRSHETWGGVPLPLDLGMIGMAGCPLRVSIDVTVPVVNQGGFASLPLSIPYDFRLLRAAFGVQAFVLDPGAKGNAVVSSAGLCLVGAK